MPLWARNPAPARPERVRVEVASPECMRTRRARIWEERAKRGGSRGLGEKLDPYTQKFKVIADFTEAAVNVTHSVY